MKKKNTSDDSFEFKNKPNAQSELNGTGEIEKKQQQQQPQNKRKRLRTNNKCHTPMKMIRSIFIYNCLVTIGSIRSVGSEFSKYDRMRSSTFLCVTQLIYHEKRERISFRVIRCRCSLCSQLKSVLQSAPKLNVTTALS